MGEAFFRTLQLKLGPKEQKILDGYRTKLNKTAYIIACYITLGDGDAYIVNCGDNNMGKSSWGIKLAKRIAKFLRKYFNIPAHFIKKRDILFTPKKGDIQLLQDKTKTYQIKLLDDAYFLSMNLDFNLQVAKETTRVAMGTRGKHNVMIFNFQRPTRATKTLLERFKIMFFKPTAPDALLLCRSSLSVLSEDVWGLDPILKAKNDKIRQRRIKRNQYYITGIEFSKLKDKEFKEYKKLQEDALDKRMRSMRHEDEIISEYEDIARDIFRLIEIGEFAYTDIESTLKNPETYNFSDAQYKIFFTFYKRFESKLKLEKAKKAGITIENRTIRKAKAF